MRIGKGIHPDGVPGWCQGFSLDGGSGVRAVKVIQHGNRPGLIYNIGKLLFSQKWTQSLDHWLHRIVIRDNHFIELVFSVEPEALEILGETL